MLVDNQQPFFSIVIPTKNRSWAIKETVASVLMQSFSDFELIVVDNDDTDSTSVEIQNIHDQRIAYVRTGALSMGKNWSVGLSQCRGKYILITADKTLLKQDGLLMLHSFIIHYPEIGVFNYEYDAYYDKENAYLGRVFETSPKIISSEYLKNLILKSKFEEFSHYSGRGYNSCFSGDIIRRIILERGDVCAGYYNPDYSIAYHFVMDNQDMLYLPITPLLARQFSFRMSSKGYGNGNSYFLKTDLFKKYLVDCINELGLKLEYVPIKTYLVHSVLIDEFLLTAKKWRMKYDFDKPAYYQLNYKETLSRRSHRADVRDELTEFWRALRSENLSVRLATYLLITPLIMKSLLYPPYRFLERFDWFAKLMLDIRKNAKEVKFVYYKNVMDCAKNNPCLLPNWNDASPRGSR